MKRRGGEEGSDVQDTAAPPECAADSSTNSQNAPIDRHEYDDVRKGETGGVRLSVRDGCPFRHLLQRDEERGRLALITRMRLPALFMFRSVSVTKRGGSVGARSRDDGEDGEREL